MRVSFSSTGNDRSESNRKFEMFLTVISATDEAGKRSGHGIDEKVSSVSDFNSVDQALSYSFQRLRDALRVPISLTKVRASVVLFMAKEWSYRRVLPSPSDMNREETEDKLGKYSNGVFCVREQIKLLRQNTDCIQSVKKEKDTSAVSDYHSLLAAGLLDKFQTPTLTDNRVTCIAGFTVSESQVILTRRYKSVWYSY